MEHLETKSIKANEYPQEIHVRAHKLHADVMGEEGGDDSAPGAHDYFDAALIACKTLTATWYAKRNKIPLERVEAKLQRDDHEERQGTYRLNVQMTFHGPLSDAERAKLLAVASKCPIHKLMTTTEVIIETTEIAASAVATPTT